MAIINRPDLVEKARVAFGVLQGNIGSTISDELIGVVIMDDVTGPDVISTQHPVDAIGSSSSAAAVGFNSKVGLQNPVGSGLDIFVSRVLLHADATGDFRLRRGVIAASPNAGVKTFADLRVEGNPVGITWDENATVSLGALVIDLRLLEGMFGFELGMTLAPGDSIHIQAANTNTAVNTVHYFWQERIRRE